LWDEGNVGMTMVHGMTFDTKPWLYAEVTDVVRKGWKAQRFELRAGDCFLADCTRTPVYERSEFGQVTGETLEGDEYWYAWSVYVPGNIPQASWVFLGQFQQYYTHEPIWMFLKTSGGPLCAMYTPTINNMWHCRPEHILIHNYEFAGRWHDILVHAKWTTDSTGFTKIYVNGTLKVDFTGPTRTNPNVGIAFKYGIYRMASQQTSVVYYDEVRRGKTRQEVDILQ
jgi:hypothetical protein